MRIRLRQKPTVDQGTRERVPERADGAASVLERTVSPRRHFLAMLATSAGMAGIFGLGGAALDPKTAQAVTPLTQITDDLSVAGVLKVDNTNSGGTGSSYVLGPLGIGTNSPQEALHLGSGAIRIGTTKIADSGGVYYAP